MSRMILIGLATTALAACAVEEGPYASNGVTMPASHFKMEPMLHAATIRDMVELSDEQTEQVLEILRESGSGPDHANIERVLTRQQWLNFQEQMSMHHDLPDAADMGVCPYAAARSAGCAMPEAAMDECPYDSTL